MIALPSHGGQLRALAAQFRVDIEGLIDFSASISPYSPPTAVLERLGQAVADPHFLSLYPDSENRELRDAVAGYLSVPADSVVVANGVMPLISATLRALRLRRCLVAAPSFRGYQEALQIAGVAFVEFALHPEEIFEWTPELLVDAASREGCDAILLANPHSPSGVTMGREKLLKLSEFAAAAGIKILLDEAFVDFTPECSVSSDAWAGNALIVFRSPTKFFGIPALRVAYAVASPGFARDIRSFVHEWAVSSVASLACVELLGCREHQQMIRDQNEHERQWLMNALGELGIKAFPSRANFLLMRAEKAATGLNLWRSLIVNHGVVVRSCGNFSGLDTSYLRFGVRLRHENERLLRALAVEPARASSSV
jgi:threonine-phosphate decarboxylase